MELDPTLSRQMGVPSPPTSLLQKEMGLDALFSLPLNEMSGLWDEEEIEIAPSVAPSLAPALPETMDPPQSKSIRFGLAAIKGVGRAAVEVMLRVREEGGPFASLNDFCHRVTSLESGGVTKATIESLVNCGAFQSLPGHQNRRALVQTIEESLDRAMKEARDKRSGQGSLADMFGEAEELAGSSHREMIPVPNIPDYPRDQALGFERDLLGLYISDHPLQAHAGAFERRGTVRVVDLPELADRQEIAIGGIITSIKPFTSKKSGEPMAFFNIEDMSGTVACTMFPMIYAKFGHLLEKDQIVILRGKASHRDRVRDDDEGGHVVEVLADALELLGSGAGGSVALSQIYIQVDASKRDLLRFVRDTVEMNRGNGNALPVYLRIPEGGRNHVLDTRLKAEFNDNFRQSLERLLGRQSVWAE